MPPYDPGPGASRRALECRRSCSLTDHCIVQETQKLAKEASTNLEQTNDKLAPLLKKAYDDFAKSVQEMQSKIHEAANKQ